MNLQDCGVVNYVYPPLTKAETVMLLINHLKDDESVTKEIAEGIVKRNTQVVRCLTGETNPSSVTTVEEAEGVKLCCTLDSAYIDLSSFSEEQRKGIIAVLDNGKNRMHKAAMFVQGILDEAERRIRQLLFIIVPFLVLTSFAETEVIDGITWIISPGVSPGGVLTRKLGTWHVSGDIQIPSSVSGQKVTGLGDYLFANQLDLTSVVIPEGVEMIGRETFFSCVNMTNVVIPASLKTVSPYTFGGSGFTTIDIPKQWKEVGTAWFGDCSELKSVVVNGIIECYRERAFEGCSKLSSIEFKEGLKTIEAGAFAGCTNLTEIILPKSLESLDITAFARYYDGTVNYNAYSGGGCFSNLVFKGNCPSIVTGRGLAPTGIGSVYVGEDFYNEFLKASSRNYQDGRYYIMGGKLLVGWSNVKILPSQKIIDIANQEISLVCTNKKSTIYYTLDGSDPVAKETVSCFKYTRPFKLRGSATVRAIASVPDYNYVSIEEQDYVAGIVADVSIQSSDGTPFYRSGNQIILSCSTDDSVIRYTVNDTPVTENSPIYSVPFTISDTTIVRVKAFKTDWFPSEEVNQTFTRLWYTNETPVINASSSSFDGASQAVTLSCATEDASIYYTIDGSEPSATNGRLYRGPFPIYDSVTVKATAVKDDWRDSDVASQTFSKLNGLSAAINMFDSLPETDVAYPWVVVSDVTHDGMSAVRSGAVGNNGTTYLQVTVRGTGRLSFWWKTTCEPMCDGAYYDFAMFKVGGVLRACLAGTSEWQQVIMDITTTGKHVLRWEYQKDDADSIPPDCVWVDQVQWIPADGSGMTLTTEYPVPYDWLSSYGFGVETDFETAAGLKLGKVDGSGRPMTVLDDYIAGTNPTNLNSKLTSLIHFDEQGSPKISWTPDLNQGTGKIGVRRYRVYGTTSLVDPTWIEVQEGEERNYRFFKTTVEMP